MMSRRHCIDLFNAALAAADPYRAVKNNISIEGRELRAPGRVCRLDDYSRVIVVGAGKAAAAMAGAAEEVLGPELHEGIVVVKYGHSLPLGRIRQREASHPLPDKAGADATAEVINLLRAADERTLVLALFSGGASALLVSPVEGITLQDKKDVTDLLLKSGAAIDELNAVRKHLSKVKGGRLSQITSPAALVTLLLSDVLGDRLDVIASGPTVPDTTTFARALAVLEDRGVKRKTPQRVIEYLERGAAGREPETPKEGAVCFQKTSVAVIGGLKQSLLAVRESAETAGFEAHIISGELQGEARTAAALLAGAVRRFKKPHPNRRVCLIAGGETTVTVRGNGLGGRNQELALAFAREIDGVPGITLLSAGTDGTDGPTDAAGAIVDGETLNKARKLGLDADRHLADNDSYHFFKKLDSGTDEKHHLLTGPTGTNVMDVQIIVIESAAAG